jgi:hypothetical protein
MPLYTVKVGETTDTVRATTGTAALKFWLAVHFVGASAVYRGGAAYGCMFYRVTFSDGTHAMARVDRQRSARGLGCILALLLALSGLQACSYDGDTGEETRASCPTGMVLAITPGQDYALCVPRIEVDTQSPDGGAPDAQAVRK